MPAHPPQADLARLSQEYSRVRAELAEIGYSYILLGSVTERRIPCGKLACACTNHVAARHGPYIGWSRRRDGRTVSTYPTPEQAARCRQWIDNNRKLEKIIARMRDLSLRIARLCEIRKL